MAAEPIITCRAIAKSYYRGALEIPVLQGLDLEIPAGGYYALMGPSGSGKTTLLNLIAGIDRPTGGSLEVCGYALNDLDDDQLAAWRARHMGFIFQNYNLVPVLTAFENVELPLLLTGLGRRARRERVLEALALVSRLFACSQPHTSPAGRPTHFELTRGELSRRFQR